MPLADIDGSDVTLPVDAAVLRWFQTAADCDASDLHLVPGSPPVMRVHGRLCSLDEPAIDDVTLRARLMPLCPAVLRSRLADELDLDFSLDIELARRRQRFRVNYFVTHQQLGACFRLIPDAIPTLQWAGFPEAVADRIASFRNGLVIVSGVVGSGKSTTLAMILNRMNAAGNHRIITIEEPVEYVFPGMPDSLVTQREVGLDVRSFAEGMRSSLRQDPDVILVGEIRDLQTAQMAITAAETGLLVLSTLHARDAKGVISRLTDLYPLDSQNEVRSMLAGSLRAVVCQHLLPGVDEHDKRKLAVEVMFNNQPIASGIRIGKLQSLDTGILTGRDQGMIPLDESIRRLYQEHEIDRETALRFVSEPSVLKW